MRLESERIRCTCGQQSQAVGSAVPIVTICFVGGNEDGREETGTDFALNVYALLKQVKDRKEREENVDGSYGTISLNSPRLEQQASDEQWEAAKIKALMVRYIYEGTMWLEDGDQVLIQLTYRGMDA